MAYALVLWHTRSLGLLVAAALLFAFAGPAHPDVVGTTGTIKKVPGYPAGTELEYRIGAIKTGKKTAHFWLQIKNEEAFDIDIVVCSMLNLKKNKVDDDDYNIEKVDGKWVCSETTGGKGPESYHFGCKQLTIPAGTQRDAFDEVATFASDACDENGDSLLGTVYFDLLKDCPLMDCDQVKGARKFLSPTTPADHDDWANVWAGGVPYEDLTDTGLSREEWPSGNWVTMNKSETSGFPSRMIGTLMGAPAGALVDFVFDGVPGGTYSVPHDPSDLPCGGLDVLVDELYTIPPGVDSHDEILVSMPDSPCGTVAEGSVMRFNAEVLAEPGAPVYSPGDFMYGIDIVFVRDTVAPSILDATVAQDGALLAVAVDASDATSLATGATLVYSIDGGPDQEHAIAYAIPSEVGGVMFFDDLIQGLPQGRPITWRVDVYDDVGNVASTTNQVFGLLTLPALGRLGLVLLPGLLLATAWWIRSRR